MKKIAEELVKMAKDLTASAGPYTLLEQLNNDWERDKLTDEDYLRLVGHGFGHTKGADYIYGQAGEDIVYALIGYEAGHKNMAETFSIIDRNINQALKDNEPFRGLRGEQKETHDLWMSLMKQRRSSEKIVAEDDPWVTANEVREMCVGCADKMSKLGLSKIRMSRLLSAALTRGAVVRWLKKNINRFSSISESDGDAIHGEMINDGVARDNNNEMAVILDVLSDIRQEMAWTGGDFRHTLGRMTFAKQASGPFPIMEDLRNVEKILQGLRFDILHVMMSPSEWKDIFRKVEDIERQVGEIERTTIRMVRQPEALAASEVEANYPKNVTEQDRKKWREQGKIRRKHEGIHPRKMHP